MPCISTKCGGFLLGLSSRVSSWFSSAIDSAGVLPESLEGFFHRVLCVSCHICQAHIYSENWKISFVSFSVGLKNN